MSPMCLWLSQISQIQGHSFEKTSLCSGLIHIRSVVSVCGSRLVNVGLSLNKFVMMKEQEQNKCATIHDSVD